MTINIKYFASLKDIMGKSEEQITIFDGCTVKDVWEQVSKQNEDINIQVLCALNFTHVTYDTVVQENDEVAFFPPVTGG